MTALEDEARALVAWAATATLFAWAVPPGARWGWVIGVTSVAVIGLLAGRLARTRRALHREAEQNALEKSHRVLLEERARIARDLHDVVAHHMSLVVVQAESAPYRLPGLPTEATAELASISSSARAALTDTRALLSVLRSEDESADRAPQPGLGLLPDLLDDARRAGVVATSGPLPATDGLRPSASLAAYRIVQEAMANAARHAPGAPVRVEASVDGDELILVVRNGPSSARSGSAPDPLPGHGIVGMRERAGAEGGTLSAAPTPDGGFEVRAVLPVASSVGRAPDGTGGRS